MLESLKGLGPKRIQSLHAANIYTLRDILFRFPYRYKDTSQIRPIASISAGELVALECRFEEKIAVSYFNRLNRIIAHAYDGTGRIKCVWFNCPWIKGKLNGTKKYILYGRVYLNKGELFLSNPSIEAIKGFIPVYKKIEGISSSLMQQLVQQVLEQSGASALDFLPFALCKRYDIFTLQEAVYQKHFPQNVALLRKANQRILLNEILIYLYSLQYVKKEYNQGIILNALLFKQVEYWNRFPFQATLGQQNALHDIILDLQSNKPMTRLVQGDVGSGKTAVALGAALYCVKSGFQCAFMAPTEILAYQLYQEACKIFKNQEIQIVYLSGKCKAKEKREALANIENGVAELVIGTHALFSEKVVFNNLGLVITDEQHRFGVAQRKSLENKKKSDVQVNVLVMSATPIPRSVALSMMSDLDISLIQEMPQGRKIVSTSIVPEHKREDMYQFIEKQVQLGKQAFIICKHVETVEDESIVLDVKSHFKEVSTNIFPNLTVSIVYGNQKQEEKEKNIQDFKTGKSQVLVATTVVEVGVNVPNANVIVVENADMYGLSQLHQLRGRVGRDGAQAWCFLMCKENEALKKFASIHDGFEIAKLDFTRRGPGQILGFQQHGESDLSTLLMQDSAENIITVSKEILELLKKEPNYYDLLRQEATIKNKEIFDNITLA